MYISVAIADPDPLLIDRTALATPDKTLFTIRFPRQAFVSATDKVGLLGDDAMKKVANTEVAVYDCEIACNQCRQHLPQQSAFLSVPVFTGKHVGRHLQLGFVDDQ
jgi:hypothetical protein